LLCFFSLQLSLVILGGNPYKSLRHIQLTGDVPDKTLVKKYFMGWAQGSAGGGAGSSHQGPEAILLRILGWLNKIDVGIEPGQHPQWSAALANVQIMLLTHF